MVFVGLGRFLRRTFKLKLFNTEDVPPSTYSTGMWPPTKRWHCFFFAVADKFVDSINQFGNQHLEAVFKIYLAAEILVSFTVLDTNSGTQVVILVFFLCVIAGYQIVFQIEAHSTAFFVEACPDQTETDFD